LRPKLFFLELCGALPHRPLVDFSSVLTARSNQTNGSCYSQTT
jgi:hypothetical protein